jgi:protein required for attachment to host cells
MTTTWILLADRSRARILSQARSGAPLVVVEDFDHPEGRLHDRDIDSDKPGRVFDKAGVGRHAVGSEELPHERAAHMFAKHLAERLRAGRQSHAYEALVLAAEPRFLGLLRGQLDPTTRKQVTGELHRHMLGMHDGDITTALEGVLPRGRPVARS